MNATNEEPRRGGTRAAARNLGWLLSSKGLDALLGLVYLGITTRALGITDFGRFSLIVGAAQAIIALVAFPTWQIVIQFGVGHLISGDKAALGRLFRAAALLDCLAAVLGTVIVALVVGLFSRQLGVGAELRGSVLFFALVLLLTLRSTPLGILRLRDDYAGAAWADSFSPVVKLIGTGIAWAVSPTIEGFLAVWAVSEIARAAAFWWVVARKGDLAMLLSARVDRETVARENPGFLRFAFSTNANVTLNLSERQLPLLLVGAIAGTAAAGAFGLAFQVSQALSKLAQMLTRAAFPELVHAVRRATAGQVRQILWKIALASSASAAAIMLLVAVIGKPVLGLIGGEPYIAAFPILLWLAAGGCLDLAAVGFEPILMALHRAGSAFLIRVLAAGILIAGCIMLTPGQGAVGAAIAMLIGTAVTDVLLALVTLHAVRRMEPGQALESAPSD